MKENIKISVIVPCYNQAKFLPETLDSVLAQTFQNWECIIVNDGSTDDTKEIAEIFCAKDKRFNYYQKVNAGLSAARNSGLDIATGDYIQFLDSDDILNAKKFEIQLDYMLSDSSIDFCISKYKFFSSNIDETYDLRISTADFNCTLDGFLFSWEDYFSFPPVCYFIRKEFLDKNKILFNENLKAMEDWYFLIQSSINNAKFHVNQEFLALYRKHANNMSGDPIKMSKSLIECAISIVELLPENKKEDYRKKISLIILKRLGKSFGNNENAIKAKSIDYKVGHLLLFPFHSISSFIKKQIRKI